MEDGVSAQTDVRAKTFNKKTTHRRTIKSLCKLHTIPWITLKLPTSGRNAKKLSRGNK